jgi:hypothetical protein
VTVRLDGGELEVDVGRTSTSTSRLGRAGLRGELSDADRVFAQGLGQ